MGYHIEKSIIRIGWCVYKQLNSTVREFVAGPFGNKELAESECYRLTSDEQHREKDTFKKSGDEMTVGQLAKMCGVSTRVIKEKLERLGNRK